MAALVLVIVVAHLADKLLDRSIIGAKALTASNPLMNISPTQFLLTHHLRNPGIHFLRKRK